MPHDTLLVETRECVENNGMIPFQNEVGVSIDSFLKLLGFYLKSTFAVFMEKAFT